MLIMYDLAMKSKEKIVAIDLLQYIKCFVEYTGI